MKLVEIRHICTAALSPTIAYSRADLSQLSTFARTIQLFFIMDADNKKPVAARRWYHWYEPGTTKEEKWLIFKLDLNILTYLCLVRSFAPNATLTWRGGGARREPAG